MLAIFNDLQKTSRNTKAFKHYQIHPHRLENKINRSNNIDKLYQCRLLTKKKKKRTLLSTRFTACVPVKDTFFQQTRKRKIS